MKDLQLNKFKHHIDLNVRFMDVDALHHVNNARYLNFLEESRIAYSQQILGMFKKIDDFNVVVARIEIDFLQPLAFHDSIRVYTRVSKLGTKSFEFESIICAMRDEQPIPAAHALQTIVAFDLKSQKSIPIPDDIKLKVSSYEEEI
jgi:acyl-CoA thioester hydrolase